ncbi:putative HLA class I histocompatibility antigen, alpha chain H isoform X2 [Colossoma macropomum]|nr:putative HLA class I histocompatibility antigen, alpha chain H isoform X2 [Colossoma macropomum]
MFTYTTGLVTIPDRMAVTYIDDVQITRYDSRSKTLTSSCGWVKTAMNESWKYYEDLCTSACNRRREDFSEFAVYVGKKEDVQTFQWISHCIYDDQKGVCEGYEKYGYNGEDFISLEVKQMRYVPHTPDAAHITDIWNKQRDRIDQVKHYFTKEFPVYLKRAAPYLTTAVFPDVYLLQKNSSSPVVCLATGFNSSAVTMIWRKNGQDLHEDVDEGETLPNGDGTFQKRISLKVETEEWKENQYRCVVQQENWKKMIIKNVTEDEIKHNLKHRTHVAAIISTIIFLLVLLLLPFLMRLHRG